MIHKLDQSSCTNHHPSSFRRLIRTQITCNQATQSLPHTLNQHTTIISFTITFHQYNVAYSPTNRNHLHSNRTQLQ
ncbi:hypothetical protein Hanom_Chr01g00034961 [Helianthus anomalus]